MVFVAAGTGSRCTLPQSGPQVSTLPYRLESPDTVITLDRRLREVSGLTWLTDGRLGTINDEKGDLFVLDAESGEIVDRKRFAGDGDYEGIQQVGSGVYVLRSDGRLYHIPIWQAGELDASRIDTGIGGSCDAEGLTFHEHHNSLLIACKEGGKKRKTEKAVYRFSLESGELAEDPYLLIDALDPSLIPDEGSVSRYLRKVLKISSFKPSGIAIHPYTGEIYVLSSRSYGLAAFARDGTLSGSAFIDPDVFPQAEGVTFAPDGTLYIASEGRGGGGRLARFKYFGQPGSSGTSSE